MTNTKIPVWIKSVPFSYPTACKGIGDFGAEINNLLVYSCYCTPRWSDQEFEAFFDDLDYFIRIQIEQEATLITAANFNSHLVG